MQRHRLALIATLVAAAGCTSQQSRGPSDDYVPNGQVTAQMSRDQALRECRQQVESAGRETSPALGPLPVRQIPPPPASLPQYTSIQACMESKGFRRATP